MFVGATKVICPSLVFVYECYQKTSIKLVKFYAEHAEERENTL